MTIQQPRSTAGKWFLVIMLILNITISVIGVIFLSDGLNREKLATPILLIALLIYLVCSIIQFQGLWKRSVEIPNLTDILNLKKVYKLNNNCYFSSTRLPSEYEVIDGFGNINNLYLCTVCEIFPNTMAGPEIICAHSVVPPKQFCLIRGGHLKEINDGDYDTLCSTNQAQGEARTKVFA